MRNASSFLVLAILVGCSSGEVDLFQLPSAPSNYTAPSGSTSGASAPEGVVATTPSCDVGLNRAGVAHYTDGLRLYLYVPATNAEYVRVWTPEVNETYLGQGPIFEWFSVVLPEFGEYRIKLAVEYRTGDPNRPICQDDRHSFVVTVTPPPPPPPGCRGEECFPPPPPPDCEVDCEPPPPPEEHGDCIYEVAGPKSEKETLCFARGGTWSTHDGSDHCIFAFPGIADRDFNLAPGLSDPECLRKQDE